MRVLFGACAKCKWEKIEKSDLDQLIMLIIAWVIINHILIKLIKNHAAEHTQYEILVLEGLFWMIFLLKFLKLGLLASRIAELNIRGTSGRAFGWFHVSVFSSG